MRKWVLGCLGVFVTLPVLLCLGAMAWWTRPLPLSVGQVPEVAQAKVLWKKDLKDGQRGRAWLRALLAQQGTWGPVDVWLWGLPDGFRFTVPKGVKVVGALQTSDFGGARATRLWFRLPPDETVLQEFVQVLRNEGWREPWWARVLYAAAPYRTPQEGFVDEGRAKGSPLMRLYCNGEGDLLQMMVQRETEQGGLAVTFDIQPFSANGLRLPCSWTDTARFVGRMLWDDRRGWSLLTRTVDVPKLAPPPGIRQVASPLMPWTQGWRFSHAWLESEGTELPVEQVMTHYSGQLQEQGWRLEEQTVDGQGMRTRWVRRSLLPGIRWRLDLSVVRMNAHEVTAWMVMYPEGTAFPWGFERPPVSPSAEVRIHGPDSPQAAQEWLTRWWMERMGPEGRVVVYPGSAALPLPFPRPKGVWVLGSFEEMVGPVGGFSTRWILHGSGDEEAVRAQMVEGLRQGGWYPGGPPRPTDVGFLDSLLSRRRDWDLGRWCHAQREMSLFVQLWPDGEGEWWIFVNQGSPFGELPCPEEGMPGEMDSPRAPLPALMLPEGVPATPGIPLGGGFPNESVWIPSRDKARTLAALHEQLKAQGGVLEAQGQGGGVMWSRWAFQSRRGRSEFSFYLIVWDVADAYSLFFLTLGPSGRSATMGD